MPLFYFNFTSDGLVTMDEVGTEFPSLEEAYLDTWRAVLEISFEKLGTRDDPNRDSFDILDNERRPLMHVPFSDVLRPRQPLRPTTEHQWVRTIDLCRKEIARSRALQAEVGKELKKAQQAFLAIRANLRRLTEISESNFGS
jgi:hypothetical protein